MQLVHKNGESERRDDTSEIVQIHYNNVKTVLYSDCNH